MYAQKYTDALQSEKRAAKCQAGVCVLVAKLEVTVQTFYTSFTKVALR